MSCSKRGKEIVQNAAFCIGCNCPVSIHNTQTANNLSFDGATLLNTLSRRLTTNGIVAKFDSG